MLGRIRAVAEAERADAERAGKANRAAEAEVMGEDTVKDSELSVDGAEGRDDEEDSSNAMETGTVAVTLRDRMTSMSVPHCTH